MVGASALGKPTELYIDPFKMRASGADIVSIKEMLLETPLPFKIQEWH